MTALLLPLFLAAYASIRGQAAGSTEPRPVIALLLPESKTARYETQDRRHFEARVRQLCPACRLLAANANQDAAAQQAQAEAALSNGVDVLVLDPVDSAAAGATVAGAKAAGVRVVSYDRLVLGAHVDYYVSFDKGSRDDYSRVWGILGVVFRCGDQPGGCGGVFRVCVPSSQ